MYMIKMESANKQTKTMKQGRLNTKRISPVNKWYNYPIKIVVFIYGLNKIHKRAPMGTHKQTRLLPRLYLLTPN